MLRKLTEKQKSLELELQEAQRQTDQVEFQLTTAREQLAEAEKLVLTKEGLEKQHEIWVQALQDAAGSAQRELDSLSARLQTEREQNSSLQTRTDIT